MDTGAAGDGLFRGVYHGCIPGNDMGIRRRPYHRNCSCALHKTRGQCSHVSPKTKVSYRIRRAWSENCLVLMASGQSSPCTPPPAAAIGEIGRRNSNLALFNEEEDQ